MRDVSEVAASLLKLMGIFPIIDRLMDVAIETVDGEYGSYDDDDDEVSYGICYSEYNLMSNGVLCGLLDAELTDKNLEFFVMFSGGNLDLHIERSTWGDIKLSLHIDVPLRPNAATIDETFHMDIEIMGRAPNFVIVGTMFEDEADAYAKYLTYYALM